MKKLSFLFAAAIAVGMVFSVYADGGWIFDSTAKTLTYGDNVIKNVTVKNATSKTLTIGDNKSNADIVQLDFTLPIADGDGNAYTIDSAAGSIGTWQGNTHLESVRLPQPGCNSIQWDMFKNCTALTSVEIVEGTTTIGSQTFNGCTALESVSLPSTLTSIGSAAFQSAAIKSIVVPGAMETVNAGFVPECAQLESFVVSMGCKTFGAGNFFKKTTSLKYVEFPSTLEQVTGTDWFDYAYNKCDVIWPVFPKKGFAAKNCPYGGHDTNNTKTNYIHWSSRQEWIDYSATNAYGIVFNMPATYDGLGSWVGNHTQVIKYYVPDGGVVPWEVSLVKEQSGDYTVGVTVANVAGKVYAKATCEGESDVIVQISDSLGVGGTATATLLASSLTPGKSYAVTVYGESSDGEVVLGNFAGYAGSTAPTDKNYWTNASGDGLASTSANWSRGTPVVGDDIVIDGKWCNADLSWDLSSVASVASWEQTAEYTGTVTIPTTFPSYANSTFKTFTVTGALTINGGKWTHPANSASEDFRLKVMVGGNVAIASGVKINASGKGFAKGKSRPGSAKGCHASPMGSAGLDELYGDVKKPEALGSGNDKGAGGGAIYIEATGSFVNYGELNVNSLGGAAGSIYVKAASVSGTGAYYARAPESVDNSSYQAGSGGRIAFELTDSASISDDEAAFVNGKCATSFAFNGRNSAAGGTVLVKSTTHANGVLYVDGQSGAASYSYVRLQPEFKNMLAIPAGEAWTLDGIVFLNKPMSALKVPAGTSLSLPGGLASVKAYGSGGGIGGKGGHIATGNRGLVVDGGNLVLPAVEEHLIADNWTLQSSQSFTLTGDVRVNAGGRIGVVAGYGVNYSMTNRCDLTISGNLNVETKGSIDATGAGWKNYKDTLPAGWGWTVNGECGAHGGVSSKHSGSVDYVYDSILNPMLPGEGAQNGDAGNAVFGGGCVKLTVSGKLTLDGSAHAKSNYQDVNGGAGGTINITCGSIEGSGTINVTTQSGYGGTQGGGGRVAIRLTGKGADFAGYPVSRITVAQSGAQSSGGTIYLQTAAEEENCGTVYIRGDAGNTATCLTPFPSLAGGGEKDNFSAAKLQIVNNGKAVLSADVNVAEFGMGNTGALDFNGMVLKVCKAILSQSDGAVLPKLAAGTYTASQLNELTGTSIYTDSVGGGSLVVKGVGLKLFLR